MTTPDHAVRVLHVLEAIEGGTARHVVDVVRHVPGVEHHVVAPHERVGGATDRLAAAAMADAGATLHELDMRRDPARLANAVALARITRLVRQVRPHVVHGHSSIGGLLGRLAATATRLPGVYTPNGITDVRAGIMVERALGRLTTRFVAVSASERTHALDLHLVRSDRLVLINNGIDPEPPPTAATLDLRETFGLAPEVALVGTISRLVPQKAPVDLITAWRAVHAARPDVHFVLIGSGPLQAEVDRAVRQSGLASSVHQIAALDDAWTVLDQLDVFSLASTFEGAPYALLEAIRAGCPIAATDAVGTHDIVRDGQTGALTPVGDTAALARNIVGLLEDRAHAQALTAAARDVLANEFHVASMGAQLQQLYRELISS